MLVTTEQNVLVTTDYLLAVFADFLNIDVGAGDAATDTLITYRRQIQQFINWCDRNNIYPAEVSKDEIKRYRRWMIETKKFKPATVALKLSVVRRFYQAAVEKGLLSFNPATGIKPPREKRDPATKITYLEQSELETLLTAIPNDNTLKASRDKALIAIMALEGPRTVELHRANISDIVKQGKNLGIRVEGKRNIRTIPLTVELAELLLKYIEIRQQKESVKPSSPLFIAVGNRAKGQRISRRGIRLIVDNYLKK